MFFVFISFELWEGPLDNVFNTAACKDPHLETKGTKDKRTARFSDRASVFSKPLSHVMNAFAADASSYRGVPTKVGNGP